MQDIGLNIVVSGETEIDLEGYFARIIVEEKIINLNDLKWRHLPNGNIILTLDDIAEQLFAKGYKGTIYVWVEGGLEGKIYQCNNYNDRKWYKHGVTKGYA